MTIFKHRNLNLKKVEILQNGHIHRLNMAVNSVAAPPDFSVLHTDDLRKIQLLLPVVFARLNKRVIEVISGGKLLDEFKSREIWCIEAIEVEPINAFQAFKVVNLAYGVAGCNSAARMAAVHVAQYYMADTDTLFSDGYIQDLSVRTLCRLARLSPNSIKNKKRSIRESMDTSFSSENGAEYAG